MNEVIEHASKEASKHKGFAGALTTCNIDAGREPSRRISDRALPDGRRAAEPIAESGIGRTWEGRERPYLLHEVGDEGGPSEFHRGTC